MGTLLMKTLGKLSAPAASATPGTKKLEKTQKKPNCHAVLPTLLCHSFSIPVTAPC
jgi:hypothetical protein